MYIFIQVSLGFSHGGCVTDDGLLFTWGANQFGQLGNQNDFEKSYLPNLVILNKDNTKCKYVSCGWCFTMAIESSNGHLYSWGASSSGQLGHGKLFKGF